MSSSSSRSSSSRPSRQKLPQPRLVASSSLNSYLLIIVGLMGLFASFALTVEHIRTLSDPTYMPACNINPLVSCGSMMGTWQASIFGFPNSLLGLVGFSIVVVTGVLALYQVAMPYWYWTGLLLGIVASTILVHWFIFESLYRLHSLCPYCMLVWLVILLLLTTVISILFFPTPDKGILYKLYQWRWTITIVVATVYALGILIRFQ